MSQEYKGFTGGRVAGSDDFPLHLYRSNRTGIQVAVAEIEGPLVNSNIAIATEANDDDGCPHVLEHLIFLGSEDYPYKGVLDKLANRSFAQGTNAYTDTDHTCYQLTTAGQEGTLRILPVFLDHVLFPTLTESGFYTEVHHVNGETAEDAGVVYCEMQGTENTSGSLSNDAMMKILYKDSGYASNTGGKVANLRSLNVEKVREYHKAYYRSDNVIIIITGAINPLHVIDSLQEMETKIHNRIVNKQYNVQPHSRPFSTPIKPLPQSVQHTVKFPTDDQEGGASVSISWKACEWSNLLDRKALLVLWSYLAESSSSPTYKKFVEVEDPLCTEIYYDFNDVSIYSHEVEFDDVPTEKLSTVSDQFFALMNEIHQQGIDMERIKTMIDRRKIKHINQLENNPHNHFLEAFIATFLYASKPDELISFIDVPTTLQQLEEKDQSYWNNLLEKYILQEPHVCIQCIPSPELATQNENDEEERMEKRKKELGKEGLNKCITTLKKMQDLNAVPIPETILSQFHIPDVSKIEFFKTSTCRNTNVPERDLDLKLYTHIGCSDSKLPFMIQFDHFDSHFIKVEVCGDSRELSVQQRLYLPLFLECMFKVPLQRPGQPEMKYKQVLDMLDKNVIDYNNGVGYFCGGRFSAGDYSQVIKVSLKVDAGKYEQVVDMMADFLWNTKFTIKKIKVAALNLINSISSTKRDPEYIGSEALNSINFDNNGNFVYCTSFLQERFLNNLVAELDKPNGESILENMRSLRNMLFSPNKILVHVTADMYAVPNPMNAWKQFVSLYNAQNGSVSGSHSSIAMPNVDAKMYLSKTATGGNKLNHSFGIKSTDSGYLYQTAPGLSSFKDADHAALAVLIEYLTGFEGPFWTGIRGKGLSYNFTMSSNRSEGLLYFELSDSSDVVNAYAEAQRIVNEYYTGKVEFNKVMLEASISGVIYGLISSEQTKNMSAGMQFLFNLQGVGDRYNQKVLLSKIAAVTEDDIKRVLEKYVVRLFDPKHSNTVLTTSASKVKKITKQLEKVSKKTIKVSDASNFFPTSLVV